MIRPILSALADTLWTVTYLYAEQRARLARERRDAMGRAYDAEEALDGMRLVLRLARDERDAARSAHASALADIAEARRMAGMPDTASPQDIVRALLARQN